MDLVKGHVRNCRTEQYFAVLNLLYYCSDYIEKHLSRLKIREHSKSNSGGSLSKKVRLVEGNIRSLYTHSQLCDFVKLVFCMVAYPNPT